ncbi:MAG: hypothetical protein JOZ18_15365 [Chloroflexi bacterium]|nr:hypothetical protein [Chloroflexota bacterium]
MLKKALLGVLLLAVLAGSSLATFYGLRYWKSPTPVTPQFDGQAFFMSSGQLNESNVQGNNDQLQIVLHHVPDPASGQNYYAWLLSDTNQNPSTANLLGALSVKHGEVQFQYYGTPQHANLIAITSRLLITEEKANSTPVRPTSDRSRWLSYAELPQGTAGQGMQQPRALDCLRALLYEEQSLNTLSIHGGLNIQLIKNTAKILEWIYSARENSDPFFRHRQLVRTLDYLDGATMVQLDVPGMPLTIQQVPLIERMPNQTQASYLDLIDAQLAHLLAAPGVTPAKRALALQVKQALSGNIQSLFVLVREAAKTLVAMPEDLLLQPAAQALLDNMVALSNAIFVGHLDPATNELQPGIVQIFYDVQRLASYDLQPLSS